MLLAVPAGSGASCLRHFAEHLFQYRDEEQISEAVTPPRQAHALCRD